MEVLNIPLAGNRGFGTHPQGSCWAHPQGMVWGHPQGLQEEMAAVRPRADFAMGFSSFLVDRAPAISMATPGVDVELGGVRRLLLKR